MPYSVKEIYYTIQGEGRQAGRPAIFCRFAGCNLWTGLEQDRAGAICDFCDTDFVGTDGVGGGKFLHAEQLADALLDKWPRKSSQRPYVVCTGGEPLLQLDADLIDALHARETMIHVETNGTRACPDGVDWLCVSPKAGAACVQREGDELKLIFPQANQDPADWIDLPFKYFFLQPMDGPDFAKNVQAVTDYCLVHPQWRVSLQLHKQLGIA
ncbi:MAG: 7-carboxy-7-deazaguanine synthase [Pirellulales bacterium]|nr:7-carboxy-7-deazaguanine synthase [Pirellulales bacterium]